MSTPLFPDYVQKWINKSDHTFKLMLAEVKPKGGVPPADLELHPGMEEKLEWEYVPLDDNDMTEGYLRWWSIPAGPKPGSGTTFGVKIAQKLVRGLWEPAQILTYNGSSTGNPNAWDDVTHLLRDSAYTFTVQGEPGYYSVTLESLPLGGNNGVRCSLSITIHNLFLEGKSVEIPERSDYSEIWSNQSDRAFELFDSRIELPLIDGKSPKGEGQEPPPNFVLEPTKETRLSWDCPIPSGVGTTLGYLRFWSEKPVPGRVGSGHVFGVMIEQAFGLLGADKPEGVPEPPKIKTYNGSPTGAPSAWDDVTEKFRDDKYTFAVYDKPHNYVVTIEHLMDIHFSRCSVLVTIKNGTGPA